MYKRQIFASAQGFEGLATGDAFVEVVGIVGSGCQESLKGLGGLAGAKTCRGEILKAGILQLGWRLEQRFIAVSSLIPAKRVSKRSLIADQEFEKPEDGSFGL